MVQFEKSLCGEVPLAFNSQCESQATKRQYVKIVAWLYAETVMMKVICQRTPYGGVRLEVESSGCGVGMFDHVGLEVSDLCRFAPCQRVMWRTLGVPGEFLARGDPCVCYVRQRGRCP